MLLIMTIISEVISDLGARIAVLRRARALRQADLAVAAGVGRSTISEIESGSTTTEIGNYLRVLAALNVLEDMNLVGRLGAADLARGIGQRARVAPMRRGRQKRRKNDVINVDDFPELALLAWNRAIREVTGEEALALYEGNWRFVDPERMTPHEKELLDRLVREYGKGVLNV